jgi:hypothetical protein
VGQLIPVRREAFGYLTKVVFAGLAALVATLGAVLWRHVVAYPQIGEGVPINAVLAFEQESCPAGWESYQKREMRSIVGAASNTENTENTCPRRMYYNEHRGARNIPNQRALPPSGSPNSAAAVFTDAPA